MRLICAALLVVACLSSAGLASARGSSGGHSSHVSSAAKTVHVRTYTKKNGTVVQSYKRRPPRR
jgi:hypothetical protein